MITKKTFYLLLLVLLSTNTALATDYYIAKTGNDGNTGLSVSVPWKTIGKANSTLTAGDTVYVREGVYEETIRPARSGTSGSYITYTKYGDEVATMSHPVNAGVSLGNRSYVNIDGINFTDTGGSWVDFTPNGSYNIIQNCYMNTAIEWNGIRLIDGAHHNKILNNTLIGLCKPHDLIRIVDSEYNLIDGNRLYYCSHVAIVIADEGVGVTNYNIIRNNVIQNKYHSNISIYGTEYVLIENNVIADGGEEQVDNVCGTYRDQNMDRDDHAGMMTNINYSIVRNNVLVNNGFGISLASTPDDGTYKSYNEHNRYYNNVLTENVDGLRSGSIEPKNDVVIKNNVIRSNTRLEINVGGSNNSIYYIDNDIGSNIVDYGVGAEYITGTINVNPLFVDSAGRDFTLQESSTLINAGDFLTVTTSSGSGTSLPVDDARYFMDGWGLIDGDTIQLEGQTTTARITAINYNTNTLTLNASLTWTNGLGVSLIYSGSAPDIGAYEYTGTEEPPTPEPPTIPYDRYFEAENMGLISPMIEVIDEDASGGKCISPTTGEDSTNPTETASFNFTLDTAGTYYLWVLMVGGDTSSNALYGGIDSSWARVYTGVFTEYRWRKIAIADGSSSYGFSLSAGAHTLRLGYGEIGTKADMLYLSNTEDVAPSIPSVMPPGSANPPRVCGVKLVLR